MYVYLPDVFFTLLYLLSIAINSFFDIVVFIRKSSSTWAACNAACNKSILSEYSLKFNWKSDFFLLFQIEKLFCHNLIGFFYSKENTALMVVHWWSLYNLFTIGNLIEHLFQRWQRICSFRRKHNPILLFPERDITN